LPLPVTPWSKWALNPACGSMALNATDCSTVSDFAGSFQLRDRPVAAIHHLDNHADSFTLSERNPNPEADVGRRSRLRHVVEQAMQRQVECDTKYRHGRLLAMLDKPLVNQGLWLVHKSCG